jgi:hypothetical protein
MTGPQLALGPWWTRDHGATRLLQGSRGRGDSSEREREEVIGVLTNGATWRRSCRDGHTMATLGGGAVESPKICSHKNFDGLRGSC